MIFVIRIRENKIIAINPQDSSHISRIKYKSRNGEIYSDDEEISVVFQSESGIRYEDKTSLNDDIDKTLNLNEESHYLKQNRKEVLETVKMFINKKNKESGWTAKDMKKLIREYEQPDADGFKKPYAGIVLWYLYKKMNQL